jgi:thymidine phosphorylase
MVEFSMSDSVRRGEGSKMESLRNGRVIGGHMMKLSKKLGKRLESSPSLLPGLLYFP